MSVSGFVSVCVDEDGNEMESCPHPKQKLLVRFEGDVEVEEYDILRREE